MENSIETCEVLPTQDKNTAQDNERRNRLGFISILSITLFATTLMISSMQNDDISHRSLTGVAAGVRAKSAQLIAGNGLLNFKKTTRIAYIGNSFLYYNDFPRFFTNFAQINPHFIIKQDSCFHPGASFKSQIEKGNGMITKWQTPNALRPDGTYDLGVDTVPNLLAEKWDYLVLNDFTTRPAYPIKRPKSVTALQTQLAPLIDNRTIPVFVMTNAFRAPEKKTEDQFPVEKFTKNLCEGYQEYAKALDQALGRDEKSPKRTRIAYFGKAMETIYHERRELWEKIFYKDNVHSNPAGSFLQGCLMYYTIFGKKPPLPKNRNEMIALWEESRYFYYVEKGPDLIYYPSMPEAIYLRQVAHKTWKDSLARGYSYCN